MKEDYKRDFANDAHQSTEYGFTNAITFSQLLTPYRIV